MPPPIPIHVYTPSSVATSEVVMLDVGHSLYFTHQDEDTPTSITTADIATLDGIGDVLHQTKTHFLHISSHYIKTVIIIVSSSYSYLLIFIEVDSLSPIQ